MGSESGHTWRVPADAAAPVVFDGDGRAVVREVKFDHANRDECVYELVGSRRHRGEPLPEAIVASEQNVARVLPLNLYVHADPTQFAAAWASALAKQVAARGRE